jgi:multicomponent Na+:H+ antiporter subunit G
MLSGGTVFLDVAIILGLLSFLGTVAFAYYLERRNRTMNEIISGILLIVGSLFILLAAVGLIKMPDLYTRMSATTKASTLGVGLVLIGTSVYFADVGVTSRALIIIIFLLLTAPIAAHMIARAAYFDGVPLWKKTWKDDLKGKYDEDTHELAGENSTAQSTKRSTTD